MLMSFYLITILVLGLHLHVAGHMHFTTSLLVLVLTGSCNLTKNVTNIDPEFIYGSKTVQARE